MRYFLEVSYKGTNYSGFQSQKNANTIQAEIENALTVLFRIPASQLKTVAELYDLPGQPASTGSGGDNPLQNGDGIRLIGSSRTDAGVHAVQNFFHFDDWKVCGSYVGMCNRSMIEVRFSHDICWPMFVNSGRQTAVPSELR